MYDACYANAVLPAVLNVLHAVFPTEHPNMTYVD
jgi:hypothetical protein